MTVYLSIIICCDIGDESMKEVDQAELNDCQAYGLWGPSSQMSLVRGRTRLVDPSSQMKLVRRDADTRICHLHMG